METDRFDRIVRALTDARSRRGLLGLLATSLLATRGWDAATGKDRGQKEPEKCKPKCTVCRRCRNGKCKPNKIKDGASCADGKVCAGGRCVPLLCGPCRVFLTFEGKAGSALGGLAGGDAFCQQKAEAAGLSGMYRAWLSAGPDSPANRFTNRAAAGPYQLVPNPDVEGGTPPSTVAASFADLTRCDPGAGPCLEHPINRAENGFVFEGGVFAWTGTTTDGTPVADTCGGWTTDGVGVAGGATAVDATWTNIFSSDCHHEFALYCFEQA